MKHTIQTRQGNIVIHEMMNKTIIEIHTEYHEDMKFFNIVAKNVGIPGITDPDIEFNLGELLNQEIN